MAKDLKCTGRNLIEKSRHDIGLNVHQVPELAQIPSQRSPGCIVNSIQGGPWGVNTADCGECCLRENSCSRGAAVHLPTAAEQASCQLN